MVVDLKRDAADDLRHVHPLGADAEVLLEEVRIAVAARDAHGYAAEVDVRFVLHPAHGYGAARKAQNLLGRVGGNGRVRRLLHVVPVDGERGQTLLGVRGEDGREVHRARALRAIEAPDRLDGAGVHVERLAAVAPATRDGERRDDVLRGELVGAGRGLRAAADGGVGDDALHGRAVGIAQVLLDELFRVLGHRHRLGFQTLAHAAPATVDGRTDTDLRIQHKIFLPVISEWFYMFRMLCSMHSARPARSA